MVLKKRPHQQDLATQLSSGVLLVELVDPGLVAFLNQNPLPIILAELELVAFLNPKRQQTILVPEDWQLVDLQGQELVVLLVDWLVLIWAEVVFLHPNQQTVLGEEVLIITQLAEEVLFNQSQQGTVLE